MAKGGDGKWGGGVMYLGATNGQVCLLAIGSNCACHTMAFIAHCSHWSAPRPFICCYVLRWVGRSGRKKMHPS